MAARKPAKSSSKKTAAPKKAAKATAAKTAKPKAASKAEPTVEFQETAKPAAVQAAVPYPDYPVVETTPAILCLIVNVLLLPGIGTIIAGAIGKRPLVLKGILQLVLTIVLVGWIWAIVSGVKILRNAIAAAPSA